MRLTVLRNDPMVPPGRLAHAAADRGIEIELVALDAGDSLPAVTEVEAVAVLGGEMGAYDVDEYPHLTAEKTFLRSAVEAGVPVLGLCLGCQLLADALGGSAFLADRPEVVIAPVTLVTEDPVVRAIAAAPTVAIHRDTWTLPAGGTLVATSDLYNQAFRYGSALGVQPHPEVESGVLGDWLDHPGTGSLVAAAGADTEMIRSQFSEAEDEMARAAMTFFHAWFDEVEDMLAEA